MMYMMSSVETNLSEASKLITKLKGRNETYTVGTCKGIDGELCLLIHWRPIEED